MIGIASAELTLYSSSAHFLSDYRTEDMLKVVSRICGLNSQSARAPFISLWSRIRGFSHEQYLKERYAEKKLIKTWLMRGTVHTVPADEYPIYLAAMKSWAEKRREKSEVSLARMGFGLSASQSNKVTDQVARILADEPMTINQIVPRISELLKSLPEQGRRWRVKQAIFYLSNRGVICHGQPTGTWYHFKENRFVPVSKWLNGQKNDNIHECDARRLLALRYISGYGPVTIPDFAYWTGFKVSEAKRIFADIEHQLHGVKIKDTSGTYWITEDQVEALKSTSHSSSAPVRFLPEFDPLIMGHKDKSRILSESYRKQVFLRLANVAPVFLLNGRIAGTWSYKISDKSYDLHPFEKLGKKESTEVEREFARLRDFLGGTIIKSGVK